MDDLDNFRRSSLSVRQEEERTAEIAALRMALRNLCLAVEEILEDEKTADLQDHYEGARACLGEPVVIYDGGPEGEHFHLLDFDPEEEGCQYCDDAGRAKEETDAARR